MYVRSLEIMDLRAFRSAKIELLYPKRARKDGFENVSRWPPRFDNVNVMLGVNGSGKSTILDAVALALMSPIIASTGYRPLSLIRRSNKGSVKLSVISADLVLHDQDAVLKRGDEAKRRLRTVIEKRGDVEFVRADDQNDPIWENLFDDDSAAFFFVGYGATRRTEATSSSDLAVRRRSRQVRYERVASLFEDHFALTALNAWLPQVERSNPGRYKQVVQLIDKLLPKPVRFTGKLESGEYLFKHGTIDVPFSALSDGYRTYIGWVSDLLYHLTTGAPSGLKLVDGRGVVMVDEIDLHIHPEWQRTIIPTLARTLKNIQFIFTTHSPIIVGTLERANIYNVRRGRGGLPIVERPEEETFGLSADQVLRTEVFGLDSTRDPEFQKKLHDLQQAAQRGEKGAALQFMREAAVGGGDVANVSDPPDWLVKLTAEQAS
jgi:hypothetical protein